MISQLLLNAIMLGIVLSLVALGLVLVLSIMNVVNFAHGEFYTIGGFIAYFVFDWFLVQRSGWPPLLAYCVAFLACFLLVGALGFLTEKALMRPFRGDLLMGMMATIALSVIFSMLMAAGIGAGSFNVRYPISGNLTILGASVSTGRLIIMILGASLCSLLLLFIKKTKFGMAMRACMLNREVALLQGINYGFISSLGFGIGCAMAGLALNAFAGGSYLMKSFIIIILGGLGSIPGTILAAFLLGLLESFGSYYFGPPTVNLLSFILIILILIFRPQGLLGRAE
jgi:branched-chain amino acid transport system permease protein